MVDSDEGSAPPELEARLAALEQGFARLTDELVAVRALVGARASEASGATPGSAPTRRPQPRPAYPPEAPRIPKPPRPAPTAQARTAPAATSRAPGGARPPAPPSPPRPSLGDRARDWDLTGPRGFAIAGGAVLALGIGLFFVLAANRGWIDERARVALGASASALAVGAGLLLRARYGQYLSALAAVGAGIAGAYATLAASAARYDLVPDALALPLAGVVAAVATVIALRWRSQIIAAIGLLGAALAPALQALDTDLTWESAAFAVIVLAAAVSVSVPRGWRELLVAASAIVGAQVAWLLLEVDEAAGAGDVVVAATFVLVLLATSVALQVERGRDTLDPVALPYALAATGAAYAVAAQLFDERSERGIALLAAAAIWGLVFGALQQRRLPDLGIVVGAAALALAAVATADLLSDAVLTLAFSAQAVLLAVLASRLADVRLQVLSLAYAVLAGAHVLAVDARVDRLFDEQTDHLAGVLPLAAAALAVGACGALAPARHVARTETGLLAFVADLRALVDAHRRGLREALLFAAAAFGTLAASFALVSASFEWGHVASSLVAAAAGAYILGLAGRRGSDLLAGAAWYWLGVVLVEAFAFDAGELPGGGRSGIAAAAGLLAGAYANRVLSPEGRARDVACAAAAVLAAGAGSVGIADLADTRATGGLGLLAASAVYLTLAAGVFGRAHLRDVATALWAVGLVFLVGAELLLIDAEQLALVVVAATGALVALLSGPLEEGRMWSAGALITGITTLATFAYQTPASHFFEASSAPAAGLWALLGCLVALAGVAIAARVEQRRFAVVAVVGGLALYAVSLLVLDLAESVSTASVETDFERGHTAVSAVWALVGLGLLLVGLLRASSAIRYAGLVLFGLSIAKIFLYDLAELSSVARAFSFIFVGALLLAGGFFLQRLSSRLGRAER